MISIMPERLLLRDERAQSLARSHFKENGIAASQQNVDILGESHGAAQVPRPVLGGRGLAGSNPGSGQIGDIRDFRCVSLDSRNDLFQSLGDMEIGAKGYFLPTDWFGLGGLFSMHFINAMGKMAFGMDGTSFGFDLLSTIDITEIDDDVPLRANINVGYLFDRASNLIKDIEERIR